MATAIYEIKGPDGYIYEVEGPDDASDADILSFIEQNWESYREPEEEEDKSWYRGIAGAFSGATAAGVSSGLDLAQDVVNTLPSVQDIVGIPREKREPFQPAIEGFRDTAEVEQAVNAANRPDSALAGFGYDAASSLAVMLPSIGFMLATRMPNAGLALMGIPAFGTAYEEELAKSGDKAKAIGAGITNASIETGTEKIFGVFERIGGDKTVKDILETMLREGGSEVAAEEANIIWETLKGGEEQAKEGGYWDRALEILGRIGYAGSLGLAIGGGLALPGVPGARARAGDEQAAADAEQAMRDSTLGTLPTEESFGQQFGRDQLAAEAANTLPIPTGPELATDTDVLSRQCELGLDFPQQPPGFEQLDLDLGGPTEELPVLPGEEPEVEAARARYREAEDTVSRIMQTQDADEMWRIWEEDADRIRAQEDELFRQFREGGLAVDPEVEFERQRGQEQRDMFQDFEALNERDELRQLEEEITRLEQAELQGITPEERENIASRHDEVLDELSGDTTRWAQLANPDSVPYMRSSERSQWSVTEYSPETGRVVAQFENDNGRLLVTWNVNGGPVERHYDFTDPETGALTDRRVFAKKTGGVVDHAKFRKNLQDVKVPTVFKQQVDRALRIGAKYGNPEAAWKELLALEKASKDFIFRGATPIEQVIRNDKSGDEEATRALQDTSAKFVKDSMEKSRTTTVIPSLKEDTTARVETIIEDRDLKRLAKGTVLEARAYQVLPDGGIRVLQFQPNEDLTGYDVFAIGVDGKKYREPRFIASYGNRISPSVRTQIENLPGNTLADKLERVRTKRTRELNKEEQAARDAALATPRYDSKRTTAARPAATETVKERPLSEQDVDVLKQNLLDRIDANQKAASKFPGQRQLTAKEQEDVAAFRAAQSEYSKRLKRTLTPFYETDVKKYGEALDTYNAEQIAAEFGIPLELVEEIEELTRRDATIGKREVFEEVLRQKGKINMTAKGIRQEARGNAIINALMESDLSPQEINSIVFMYGGFLEAFNPDIQEVAGPTGKEIADTYQSANQLFREMRERGMLTNLKNSLREDKNVDLTKRYEELAHEFAKQYGVEVDEASEFLASEALAQELAPAPTKRETGLPVEEAELATPKDQRSAGPTGRTTNLPQEPADLEDSLAETIFRIDEQTQEQAREKDAPFKEIRDELTRMQEEQERGRKLSKEAIDRLRSLERIQKKSRSKDLDEVRKAAKEAIAAAKEIREQAAREAEQLRADIRSLVQADVSRRAIERAERATEDDTDSLTEEALRRQIPTLEVPGQPGVYAKYATEGDYIAAVKAELAKRPKPAKAEPKPAKLNPEQVQLHLFEAAPKDMRKQVVPLPEVGPQQGDLFKNVADRATELYNADEDVFTDYNKPTKGKFENDAKVADVETKDAVAQATFEEVAAERTYRWMPKYRAKAAHVLRHIWPSRYAGLSKRGKGAQRAVVDLENKRRGQIQQAMDESRTAWAKARAHLKKAGWKRFDTNWDSALTYYLEGVAPSYIEDQLGINIPQEARDELDKWVTATRRLAELGDGYGSWQRESTRGSVIGGRPYITHVAAQTEATAQAIERELDVLADMAEQAWNLPKTAEDVNKMTRSQLIALLSNDTHAIWSSHIRPTKGEKKGDTTAKNVLVFENGRTRIEFGRSSDDKLSSSVLKAEVDAITDSNPEVQEAKRQAKREQQLRDLRTAVLSALPTKQSYRDAVKGLANSAVRIASETPLGRGAGANQSIQKQRRLLKAQSELIRDSIPTLRSKLNEQDKKDFDLLAKAKANFKDMTAEAFFESMAARFPAAREAVDVARAQVRLNAKIREAINEVTDVDTLMSRTVEGISHTTFSSQYLRNVTASMIGSGMASIRQNRGGDWVPLSAKGTALGDATFIPMGETGFVHGYEVFVPPEVHETVRDLFGQDAGNTKGMVNTAFRKTSSIVKYMKILVSPLAHVRNFVSTRMIHWSKNAVGLGKGRAMKYGYALSKAQAKAALSEGFEERVAESTSPAVRLLKKWMTDRGVLYDGGHIGALRDLQRQSFGEVTPLTKRLHKGAVVARRPFYAAEEMFRLEDESVKGSAFLMYAAEQLALNGVNHNLLDKALEGKPMTDNEQAALKSALDNAGELVLNTYPTFSRTAPIIKTISRNPLFGAFPSFTYEMARTSWNTLVYGISLTRAGYTGRLPNGQKVNKRVAALMGAARLGGLAALWSATSVTGQIIMSLVKDALGEDEDEFPGVLGPIEQNLSVRIGDTAHQRKTNSLKPWWARHTPALISSLDPETGKYRMMSIDYVMPTGGWETELMRAVQKIQSAVESGDENVVMATTKAALSVPMNLFGNTEVLWGTFLQRLERSWSLRSYDDDRMMKKAATHVQEYIQGDDRSSDLRRFLGAAAGAVLEEAAFPEIMAQAEQAYRAGAEFIAEENPTAATRMHWMADNLAFLAGFKTRDYDFKEDWPRIFKQDMNSLNLVDRDMRESLAEGDFEDYDEFKAEFDVLNAQRQEKFDDLFYGLSASRQQLGRSVGEIARALRAAEANGSAGGMKLGQIMHGRYTPPKYANFRNTMTSLDDERGRRRGETVSKSRDEVRQRLKWYRQAMREAGYETSDYE